MGSISQGHAEVETALGYYKAALQFRPNSPQLWNNVAMCLFNKQKFVGAIACLKKALYMAPFEFIVCFNLGLVHLTTGQYASAFQFLSAAINLRPDYPPSYMYLGVALAHLGDPDNAIASYQKAQELDP